jgi:hypothetical protein
MALISRAIDHDDPTKAALSALAEEFEANAKAIQAREAAARQIGVDPTG